MTGGGHQRRREWTDPGGVRWFVLSEAAPRALIVEAVSPLPLICRPDHEKAAAVAKAEESGRFDDV